MDDDLEQNLARARRLALLAVVPGAVVLAVVLIGVALALGAWLPSFLFAVVIAGGAALAVKNLRRGAPALALAATGAGPVPEADEPRLHNLVEGLCVGIGLAPPELWLVDDPAANALAVAETVDDAHLVVTRGLLARLSLVEIEAVLAHELARIVAARPSSAPWPSPPSAASPALRGLGPVGGARFALWLPLLAAPVTRAIVGRGAPIESWSDLAAVEITRYPPGLAAALAKLADDPAPRPSASAPAVAHLWIHGARAEGAFGAALTRVYEPAPPIGERIEVLEEL